MKIRYYFLQIFLFAFLSTITFAQEKYALILDTGKQIPVPNFADFIGQPDIQTKEIIAGKYYRMVQFFELPNESAHRQINNLGIELLEYFPHFTYLAAIPADLPTEALAQLNIRAIFPLDNSLKISPELLTEELPAWATVRNQIKVLIKYHKNIPPEEAVKKMVDAGLQIHKSNGINNFFETRIQLENLEETAKLPFVAYIGLAGAPDVKDDTEGRSLHRSNVLDSGLPLGRNYDGSGVNVMVRDDGQIGPHIDFRGRLTQDLASPETEMDTHGDNVAGIMSGSGNFDPTKRGMAAGTDIYVLDYEATFLDNTMDYFFNNDVIITNSSYSNGCNTGYTIITATVDQQIYDNPTLMHVFSAGNSNNTDCGYGAGTQWGNVTGGHKQGKNVTTVANLTDTGSLVNSSSRGPAHDGRIKPDIAANGADQYGTEPNNTYDEFGGTSAAAPGIAGIFAQLQQAYKTLNGGATAPAALLKAILLNTANDLGNEGPDFRFGWGQVNAFRAVKVLEENRYQQTDVLQGSNTEFILNIPDGVRKAKIMLYWDDPEAVAGAGIALINDLDIKLEKNGIAYLPWVLAATPDPFTLDQPATRGEDHLNNVEQVEIDDPEAGDYTVTVNGTVVPFGIKNFYMVYEYQTDAVDLTYPIGGETMVPGERQYIHWDAVGQLEDYGLSYSIDGGTTWIDIATVSGTERLYANWTVPNVNTSAGKIRITSSNGNTTINEVNFNIAPMPTNLAVSTACPEGITLTWDALSDAVSYEVYVLGQKYMEVVGNSSDNTFFYPITDLAAEQYFSVHAVFANGAISRRVNAVYFAGSLIDCPQLNDFASINTSIMPREFYLSCTGIEEEIYTLEINNTGTVPQSNFSVNYQINNEPVVTDLVNLTVLPGATYVHNFSQSIDLTEEGVYELKTWTSLNENNYSLDDTISQIINLLIYEGTGTALDYRETFQGMDFPPEGYLIINSDGAQTWESGEVIQRDGTEGTVAWFNNFDYAAARNEYISDELLTPLIDLTNATDEVLAFDLAYREYQFGGFEIPDGLRIQVSTDCGNSFEDVLFEAYGTELATINPSTDPFFPNDAAVWEKKILDISAYYGQSVIFKFENLSGYGNNLFLDNINVEFFEFNPPAAQFSVSTDLVCLGEAITFTNQSAGAEDYEWIFGNTNNPSSATTAGPHTVTFFTPGINLIRLIASNPIGADTFFTVVMVDRRNEASFSSQVPDGSLTVAFTNESTGGNFYQWDFGDGNTSTAENPTHTYANSGTYSVRLTVGGDVCPIAEVINTVELLPTSTENLEEKFSLQLAPNPNRGYFNVRIISGSIEIFDWKLNGVDGKVYQTGRIRTNVMGEINVTNLVQGIYFLELTSADQRLVERVMIMK